MLMIQLQGSRWRPPDCYLANTHLHIRHITPPPESTNSSLPGAHPWSWAEAEQFAETPSLLQFSPWPRDPGWWWCDGQQSYRRGTFIPATTRIDDIKPQNEKLFADPKTGTQLMASLKEEALISLAGLSSDLSCFAWRRIL